MLHTLRELSRNFCEICGVVVRKKERKVALICNESLAHANAFVCHDRYNFMPRLLSRDMVPPPGNTALLLLAARVVFFLSTVMLAMPLVIRITDSVNNDMVFYANDFMQLDLRPSGFNATMLATAERF